MNPFQFQQQVPFQPGLPVLPTGTAIMPSVPYQQLFQQPVSNPLPPQGVGGNYVFGQLHPHGQVLQPGGYQQPVPLMPPYQYSQALPQQPLYPPQVTSLGQVSLNTPMSVATGQQLNANQPQSLVQMPGVPHVQKTQAAAPQLGFNQGYGFPHQMHSAGYSETMSKPPLPKTEPPPEAPPPLPQEPPKQDIPPPPQDPPLFTEAVGQGHNAGTYLLSRGTEGPHPLSASSGTRQGGNDSISMQSAQVATNELRGIGGAHREGSEGTPLVRAQYSGVPVEGTSPHFISQQHKIPLNLHGNDGVVTSSYETPSKVGQLPQDGQNPVSTSGSNPAGSSSHTTPQGQLPQKESGHNDSESLEVLNRELKSLEDEIKNYQSEYEKWHKEFVQWQKQHKNHPNQKQFIEYQEQYQKMIGEQQKSLEVKYVNLQDRILKKKAAEEITSTVPAGGRENIGQDHLVAGGTVASRETQAQNVAKQNSSASGTALHPNQNLGAVKQDLRQSFGHDQPFQGPGGIVDQTQQMPSDAKQGQPNLLVASQPSLPQSVTDKAPHSLMQGQPNEAIPRAVPMGQSIQAPKETERQDYGFGPRGAQPPWGPQGQARYSLPAGNVVINRPAHFDRPTEHFHSGKTSHFSHEKQNNASQPSEIIDPDVGPDTGTKWDSRFHERNEIGSQSMREPFSQHHSNEKNVEQNVVSSIQSKQHQGFTNDADLHSMQNTSTMETPHFGAPHGPETQHPQFIPRGYVPPNMRGQFGHPNQTNFDTSYQPRGRGQGPQARMPNAYQNQAVRGQYSQRPSDEQQAPTPFGPRGPNAPYQGPRGPRMQGTGTYSSGPPMQGMQNVRGQPPSSICPPEIQASPRLGPRRPDLAGPRGTEPVGPRPGIAACRVPPQSGAHGIRPQSNDGVLLQPRGVPSPGTRARVDFGGPRGPGMSPYGMGTPRGTFAQGQRPRGPFVPPGVPRSRGNVGSRGNLVQENMGSMNQGPGIGIGSQGKEQEVGRPNQHPHLMSTKKEDHTEEMAKPSDIPTSLQNMAVAQGKEDVSSQGMNASPMKFAVRGQDMPSSSTPSSSTAPGSVPTDNLVDLKGSGASIITTAGKYKDVCRFFPTCRYGRKCYFQHPECPQGPRCKDDNCIYFHGIQGANPPSGNQAPGGQGNLKPIKSLLDCQVAGPPGSAVLTRGLVPGSEGPSVPKALMEAHSSKPIIGESSGPRQEPPKFDLEKIKDFQHTANIDVIALKATLSRLQSQDEVRQDVPGGEIGPNVAAAGRRIPEQEGRFPGHQGRSPGQLSESRGDPALGPPRNDFDESRYERWNRDNFPDDRSYREHDERMKEALRDSYHPMNRERRYDWPPDELRMEEYDDYRRRNEVRRDLSHPLSPRFEDPYWREEGRRSPVERRQDAFLEDRYRFESDERRRYPDDRGVDPIRRELDHRPPPLDFDRDIERDTRFQDERRDDVFHRPEGYSRPDYAVRSPDMHRRDDPYDRRGPPIRDDGLLDRERFDARDYRSRDFDARPEDRLPDREWRERRRSPEGYRRPLYDEPEYRREPSRGRLSPVGRLSPRERLPSRGRDPMEENYRRRREMSPEHDRDLFRRGPDPVLDERPRDVGFRDERYPERELLIDRRPPLRYERELSPRVRPYDLPPRDSERGRPLSPRRQEEYRNLPPLREPQQVFEYSHGRDTYHESPRLKEDRGDLEMEIRRKEPGDHRNETPPSSGRRERDQKKSSHSRDKSSEVGPETVAVKDILENPGRKKRPKQIVIILRGLPGCGKTYIAKLIKDKEVSHKAHAPRILGLDDYFLQEMEKVEKDPETGKKKKVKKMEYVYEEEMESSYRASLLKAFNKTLDGGLFPMVIIDAINDKVKHFEKFWSDAKHKGFEVYIAELSSDANECAKKNTHNRSIEDIEKLFKKWEPTPKHFKRLDVSGLLQDAAIEEVEMEEAVEEEKKEEDADLGKLEKPSEEEEEEAAPSFHLPKSKWDDSNEERLDKLDGIRKRGKKRSAESPILPDLDDDPYDEVEADIRIGKKRVRWADIEERKQLEHRKKIGFCIGTDWSVLTDPNAQVPD